jgi:hypothetical protein
MVLMHKYNGSLAASLESQRDSTVGYGSEFRDEATLSHLFARHPNWNRMIEILRHGSKWPLEPLDEDKRQADVAEALAFGNHKGASLQPKLLKKTRFEGRPLRILSPTTPRESHQDPKHPHRADEHPKAKHDQRIWTDRTQGSFDS